MNAKEFYKEKTSHTLNDDCGARLTGKELFQLMEEYANIVRLESQPSIREITDEEIEALAKEDCLSLSSIPAWIRGFKKCLFKCYGKT